MATISFRKANTHLSPEVNRILYVGNLPFNIWSEEEYDIFDKYGAIHQIRISISSKGREGEGYTNYAVCGWNKMSFVWWYVSPLAAVPIVTLAGLGLFYIGFPGVVRCIEIDLPALILLIFFSQCISFAIIRRGIFDRREAGSFS